MRLVGLARFRYEATNDVVDAEESGEGHESSHQQEQDANVQGLVFPGSEPDSHLEDEAV